MEKKSTSPATSVVSSSSLHRILLLLLSCLLLPSALATGSSGSNDGYTITGRVKLEGMSSTGVAFSSKRPNAKIILNGGQRVTFVRPDGYFSFDNVPAGTHLIEVAVLGYLFSPVRIDISARNPGKIQAALTENRRLLQELVLEPLRQENYYEIREPFSIMSIVKSPMGLMIGFMVLVVFVMPKMIDPEEMKKAQEEMRAQGVPTLSNILARAT